MVRKKLLDVPLTSPSFSPSLPPSLLSLPQDAATHNKAGRAKSRFQKRREMMIEETGDFDPIYG